MLNKVKGNMYDWVDYTWNPIKGKCPHDCTYCYMKKWGVPMKPARLVGSEFKTDLGTGNIIFVGSSCDMWAADIPDPWIETTLDHCREYNDNSYVFQSKNPKRFIEMVKHFPSKPVFGTTIESDQWYTAMANSPSPRERFEAMMKMSELGYKTFVTIEPVMNFHLDSLKNMLKTIKPSFVNIGANTNSKVSLEEPSPTKLQALIYELSEFTEVRKKSNLKRILNGQ